MAHLDSCRHVFRIPARRIICVQSKLAVLDFLGVVMSGLSAAGAYFFPPAKERPLAARVAIENARLATGKDTAAIVVKRSKDGFVVLQIVFVWHANLISFGLSSEMRLCCWSFC